MKTISSLIVPLILLAVSLTKTSAQPATLNVGDDAPKPSVFKWIKGTPVEHWRSDRMYVIEFGATWCTPCAAAIPELSAMAEKYRDKVEVISFFVMELNTDLKNNTKPAYVTKVENYVRKRGDQIQYTVGVDDPERSLEHQWLKRAGLSGIPHMFLIDKHGKIAWIGGSIKELRNAIRSLQETGTVSSTSDPVERRTVTEQKYDPTKLLLIDDNGGKQTDFLFRSILTRYDGRRLGQSNVVVQSAHWFRRDSVRAVWQDKIEVFGGSIGQFYYMAYADTFLNNVPTRNYRNQYPDTVQRPYTNNSYGKYWYEAILEVKDKSPFQYNWRSTANRYNYSLKLPKGYGSSAYLQIAMRNDLNTYFGYDIAVDVRPMPVWFVMAPDKAFALARLRSADQSAEIQIIDQEKGAVFKNADMRDIIWMLGSWYGYGTYDYGKVPQPDQAPFIDKTGIKEKIDFTFDHTLSFEQVKTHLRSMGLHVVRGTKPMKVVVIRDPAP